ncbi:amino acid deaminase/aldolase [Marinithermofilum abyssi]|nr:amino acid deaminase/aldolase [Marinithermofilum abyssi]
MPFAYLDFDLLKENIQWILQANRGKKIRLATKSIRSVAVLKEILRRSDTFQGVMCFTVAEALYLAEHQLNDLLIGYPVWEAKQIQQVAKAIANGHHITLMVDCTEHVERVEKIAREAGVCCPVCVDMDMSVSVLGFHFGVRRSPIRTKEQLLQLVQRIDRSKHLRLDGLMGYEAQIAGVGDRIPGQPIKSALIRRLKQHAVQRVAQQRAEWVGAIREMGIAVRFVNGGGTGSLGTTSKEDCVTEVTVGSGFYSPLLFDQYRDFRYRPAAGFAVEIVRKPAPGIYTCAGGGYIASGAAGKDKLPRPHLPEGAHLLPLEGAGEVQTPIRYRGPVPLDLGSPVFFRHSKAGELCERFDRLLWFSGGSVIGESTTYRGDRRCFL